jgi:hypothetical protein
MAHTLVALMRGRGRPLVLLQGAGDARDDGGRQYPTEGDQEVGQPLKAVVRPVPGRALQPPSRTGRLRVPVRTEGSSMMSS